MCALLNREEQRLMIQPLSLKKLKTASCAGSPINLFLFLDFQDERIPIKFYQVVCGFAVFGES